MKAQHVTSAARALSVRAIKKRDMSCKKDDETRKKQKVSFNNVSHRTKLKIKAKTLTKQVAENLQD